MYGIKEVGKYNIDFEGISYDDGIPYEMIAIEEFSGDNPIMGSRKTLYFRQNIGTERKYMIPEFSNENEIKSWLQHPNNTKIEMFNKIVINVVSTLHCN